MDEAHHVLRDNKWGAAISMFPNARGLGVTATPLRADGHGLGRNADGFFDDLIVGSDMRGLINRGFLTDYRIFAPQSKVDLESVPVSRVTGDYNPVKLKAAIRKSKVIGDVVHHYCKIAHGLLGVTFASDIETATDIANKFNAAGVHAAVVSSKTPDKDRIATINKFRNKELLQLVNVDLFGEGFDLPAIEVVSMARPTESYGLFVQQFGRSLRIMDGKKEAIIIDHVGNVQRHGLPDAKREWSLASREKRRSAKDPEAIPVRVCDKCTAVYQRVLIGCPYCGHEWVPARRDSIEFVDGDLHELDPAVLAAMRGEIDRVDMDKEDYRMKLVADNVPLIGQLANVKRHVERQEVQKVLRDSIAIWAAHERAAGKPDRESYKKFYLKFGVDVLGAQALSTKDAQGLTQRINDAIVSVG
jgi:superfamily II DNA or RNA helicase